MYVSGEKCFPKFKKRKANLERRERERDEISDSELKIILLPKKLGPFTNESYQSYIFLFIRKVFLNGERKRERKSQVIMAAVRMGWRNGKSYPSLDF